MYDTGIIEFCAGTEFALLTPVNEDILIVEDDPSSAKLARIALASDGLGSRTVGSAEEALSAVAQALPRLMLVDLVLPMMSGFTLAQRLKSDPVTRGIVLVAMTAFSGDALHTMIRDAGFTDYIEKPIDALALPAFVRAMLEPTSGPSSEPTSGGE